MSFSDLQAAQEAVRQRAEELRRRLKSGPPLTSAEVQWLANHERRTDKEQIRRETGLSYRDLAASLQDPHYPDSRVIWPSGGLIESLEANQALRIRKKLSTEDFDRLRETLRREDMAGDPEFRRIATNAFRRLSRAGTLDSVEYYAPEEAQDPLEDGSRWNRLQVYGTIWPGENLGDLDLVTPYQTHFRLGKMLRWMEPENLGLRAPARAIMVALIERNFRLRAPLTIFPCPECGTYFLPKRRGQVFHDHTCAHRYGERRRRREKAMIN